jgi:hypothetical protein
VYDGRYRNVDHIIVRGDLPASTLQGLNDFTVVEQRGSWFLYSKIKKRGMSP